MEETGRKTGKLTRPKQAEAAAIGQPGQLRLLVFDKTSRASFLIDTGSDISVLPKNWSRRCHNASKQLLYAANESLIHTYGTRSLNLNLGLRR